mmetsp:Transcript_103658/g.182756  ORF Transcript_103658/g.182756 Transcript_103658/m.182756 type:complete len:987 (+) Transcript_103658:116-3076(+)
MPFQQCDNDRKRVGQTAHGNDNRSKKAINRQITRVADLGDLPKLWEVIQSTLANMNGINLATAFHRVVKLSSSESSKKVEQIKHHPVFCKLFDAIVKHVSEHSLLKAGSGHREKPGEMPVQCMSIIAWSCTTLRMRHDQLLSQIAQITATRLDELKPFELSNLIWAYTKVSLNPAELFKALTARLLNRKPGEFKAQCLSTIAWAFATARRRNATVFASLAKELTARADEAKPQEISNTLWAFAKSRCADAALFEALGQAALRDGKVHTFKPQELSNTAWAFATAGIRHQALFAEIEAVAIEKKQDMVPQNVANILWAFAKLQVQPWSDLVPTLLAVSVGQLSQHKPQELSAIVWAASQMCPRNSHFFGAAMHACTQRLQDFSSNALANLLKSLSLVQVDTPRYFSRLLQECVQQLQKFEAPALCSALRGATAASCNPSLQPCAKEITQYLNLLCQHIAGRACEFLPHELLDISASVRASPKWITGKLDEAIAQAKASQLESAEKQKALEASQAGTRSVDSLSTTGSVREDGQTDDDDEDLAWPMLGDQTSFELQHLEQASTYSNPDNSTPPYSESSVSSGLKLVSEDGTSSVDRFLSSDNTPHGEAPLLERPPGLSLFDAINSEVTPAKPALEPLHDMDYMPRRVHLPSFVSSAPTSLLPASHEPGQALKISVQAALGDISTSSKGFAAPTRQALELPSVDSSSLLTFDASGGARPLDLHAWHQKDNTIGIGNYPVWLCCGIMNMRVVLKRIPAEVSLTAADSAGPNVHILRPVVRVVVNSRMCFAAYPYCENGNLTEWMSRRHAARRPTTAVEAARVAGCVMQAARVLLTQNPSGVSAVQPDEIFVDANENVYLRESIPGKLGRWQDSLKWWSPEEAAGDSIQTMKDVWPLLSWRLGLLIYCVSSGTCADPYPFHSGEMVLINLLNEVKQQGSSVLRQACMETFSGPDILHRLVGACLRVGGQQPPAEHTAFAVLQALTSMAGHQ